MNNKDQFTFGKVTTSAGESQFLSSKDQQRQSNTILLDDEKREDMINIGDSCSDWSNTFSINNADIQP